MGEISVKTGNNARNCGKNSLNRLIRCVCGKKIGPDPRNFNQRVSLGRNDLLIRTFPKTNKFFAAVSGAVGGTFGFSALAIELPLSTTIMLRSVADIARSEGFDLDKVETKQACLEVFALGGPSENDDAVDTAYYATRSFTAEAMQILSKELSEIATKKASVNAAMNLTPTQTGKWLATLIEKVATRFGIVITEKTAAQVVPVIGAFAGATLNIMFTDYYQDMARGHFIIKRLEKKYGSEFIKSEYMKILNLVRS
ncbi:EcsC family protein [Escherichia coli]